MGIGWGAANALVARLGDTPLAKRMFSTSIERIIAKGAFGAFASHAVGTAVSFALQIVLARLMGVSEYGLYTYAIAWLSIMVLFGKLGFDTALLRYLSAYRATKEWGLFKGVLRTSTIVVFTASTIVAIGTALGLEYFGASVPTELRRTLQIMCLGLPLNTLAALRAGSLRALKHVVLSRMPDEVVRPLLLAVLVGVLTLVMHAPATASTVMILQIVAVLSSFVFGGFLLFARLPTEFQQATPEYRLKEWVKTAFPLLFFSGSHIILKRIDTIMIGYFLGMSSAGIYHVAGQVARLLAFGLSSVNMIAAPMISSLHAEGKQEELQKMLTLSARMTTLWTLPIVGFFILFGEFVLSLFGQSFEQGYMALIILMIGQLFNALTGSVGYVMTMTGQQNVALAVIGGSAIVNVLLNLILIPMFGIIGAAMATAVTLVGWNLVFLFYVKRKLGLWSTIA